VTNTGDRRGEVVVLVFGSRPGSAYDRPVRRLVGFGRRAAGPGATVTVTIEVDLATLAVREDGAWVLEEGPYRLDVGLHAGDPDAVSVLTD
ncbi:MAG: fibronectin type III-like domain-contianing protein, partial [Actinomycetota bacterium]